MVTFESDGSLTFRVYLPHADSVSLVADFTSWEERAVPLCRERAPDENNRLVQLNLDIESLDYQLASQCGWWSVNLRAEDGDHAFSYLVDSQWWLPDYAAHGVKRNEQGNWTSLLFVPPTPRILERIDRRRCFDRIERFDPYEELAETPARLESLRGKVA
jgi:1,4-alpha-glucan branching enzyme